MRFVMATTAMALAALTSACGTLGSTRPVVESLPCPPSPLPPPPPVYSAACLQKSESLPISPQIADNQGRPDLVASLKARVLLLQQKYADLADMHDGCVDSHNAQP